MGKVEKHTEYYCDICGHKIDAHYAPFSGHDRFYKIRCYDFDGHKLKNLDYAYVCSDCMHNIVTKVRAERRSK